MAANKNIVNGSVVTEERGVPVEVEYVPYRTDDDLPEVEKKNRIRRNRSPLFFCEFIVKYPKTAFGLALFVHLALSSMNGILALTGYNIFPVEFQSFPLWLRGETVLLRNWGFRYRDRDPLKTQRLTVNNSVVNPQRGVPIDFLQLQYVRTDGGNIFTAEVLRKIQHVEEQVFNQIKYQKLYCQWDTESRCIKPDSLIRYFDGTFNKTNSIFYDPDFTNIPAVIYEAERNPDTARDFQFHLGKDAVINQDKVETTLTRSAFPLGWPITGDETSYDKQLRIGTFLADEVAPLLDKLNSELPPGLRVNYISYLMLLIAGPRQAFRDMALAFGSLLFIFAYIWFQTSSLWFTGWSLFSIVSSFFITNLLYRTVLGYQYFGYFHIIVIFVILGIGADDIFVLYNTWKATGIDEYPSLAHRLSDCHRRAAATMFVTSLTTMTSFLASGLSPLLPINSFGVFSALLVAVNYFSVIVFLPTAIIVYHNYFRSYSSPCCKKARSEKKDSTSSVTATKKKSLQVRFFAGPYYRFITHRYIRWILIGGSVVLACFMAWSTSRLTADSEQIKIFNSGNNLGDSWNRIFGNDAYRPTASQFIPVNIIWGVGEQNLSSCQFSDSRCRGEPTFDDRFDMNLPNVQLAMKNFCHKLKNNLTAEELGRLKIQNDTITGKLQVSCFIDNLESYMKEEARRLKKLNGRDLDLSIPLTQRKMRPFMEAYDPLLYNVSALSPSFYRYFEIAVGYWMSNGYTMLATQDYYTFHELVGEIIDPPHTKLINRVNILPPSLRINRVGFEYGTRLRYAVVEVNLSVSFLGLGYTEGIPVYDAWEEFMQAEMKKLPYQLQGGFQANTFTWHWLFVQKSLVDNAIQGILIGLAVALPVLIVATGNVIIGTFATLVICIITVCVVGVIPLAGWKLGVVSSLNLCLVVGLSVDYVVHLAEGYHMSNHNDRLGRVHDMLEHVGTSVVSGAVTTMGAAFFLFFSQITFFVQFGTFMFSCIGSSMVFSLGFFSAVLALCGPQETTGSWHSFVRWVYFRVIGRSKNDETCSECNGKGFLKPLTSANRENLKEISTTSEQGSFQNKAFYDETTEL